MSHNVLYETEPTQNQNPVPFLESAMTDDRKPNQPPSPSEQNAVVLLPPVGMGEGSPPASPGRALTLPAGLNLPRLITDAGEKATWRFINFFTAEIENDNTRAAYYRAVR